MLYVTGLTGHTGRWFHERLVKEGYKGKIRYVTFHNKPSFLDNSPLNIEKIVGDIRDIDFLMDSMQGVETVFHITGVNFSEKVIEAAIANGVKRAILVHTTGRFSKFKSASEGYIRIEDDILKKRDQIDITVIRPTMIYGSSRDLNMYKLIDYLYRHKFFPLFGKGQNLMQPVHARDLGNAYYDILVNPDVTLNKEYDLSGKEPLTYKKLLQIVSRTLNRSPIFVSIPIGLSFFAAKVYNKISKRALINPEQVLRMQEDKAFKYDLAAKDFGYSPCSFEEGIQEEVEEYLQKVNKTA